MNIDDFKFELIEKLVSVRRRLKDSDDVKRRMVCDTITFVKKWGTPPPQTQTQFIQFTVNGQPVDPSQFNNAGQPNG